MLLLIILTLNGRILIAPPIPTPTPEPVITYKGGGMSHHVFIPKDTGENQISIKEKIQREDSEIVVIVQLTLKNFII